MYLGVRLGKHEKFGLGTFSVRRVFILGMVTPEDLIRIYSNSCTGTCVAWKTIGSTLLPLEAFFLTRGLIMWHKQGFLKTFLLKVAFILMELIFV